MNASTLTLATSGRLNCALKSDFAFALIWSGDIVAASLDRISAVASSEANIAERAALARL